MTRPIVSVSVAALLVLIAVASQLVLAKNCPGGSGACSSSSTCCKLKAGTYGCCPHANATCCEDHEHCCPENTTCSKDSSTCVHNKTFSSPSSLRMRIPSSFVTPSSDATKADLPKPRPLPLHVDPSAFSNSSVAGSAVVCPGRRVECPSGYTCCLVADGQYGCCPIADAVCCPDHRFCCPPNNICDDPDQTCIRQEDGLRTPMLRKVAARPVTKPAPVDPSVLKDVRCPDGGLCQDGSTCCRSLNGEYQCCPLPSAVCCPDKVHCCPSGTTCGADGCYNPSLNASMPLLKRTPTVKPARTAPAKQPKQPVPVHLAESGIDDLTLRCADNTTCLDGSTCCHGQFGFTCCPLSHAVCCDDHVHCCPENTHCDLVRLKCVTPSGDEQPLLASKKHSP